LGQTFTALEPRRDFFVSLSAVTIFPGQYPEEERRTKMKRLLRGCTRNFAAHSPTLKAMLAITMLFAVVVAWPVAQAQTLTTLYNFTGGGDGGYPVAGLTMDQAGNLYGTTSFGGTSGGPPCYSDGCGTVFKLEHRGSGWVLARLYAFSGPDGNVPQTRVIFGPDGNLYGTTTYGGQSDKGLVFRLQPPASICKTTLCPWTETVLYSFTGGSDDANPTYGDLAFDRAGNIYGTTPAGGDPICHCGVVYELSPSNGGWRQTVLHIFHERNGEGLFPYAGVIFDAAGNLYGTTLYSYSRGDYNGGAIYELTPSEGGWTENILYTFTGTDGGEPYGGLIFDSSGNLYGVTSCLNGPPCTVYELSPSNGGWIFNVLYSFNNVYEGSLAALAMDPAGNLYGTLALANQAVFRLTLSDRLWALTGFNFPGDDFPEGNVILDASGNLYTTTEEGGTHSNGSIFEITP
jgi:uncharacterized repeat protein (TIGR03803 family)